MYLFCHRSFFTPRDIQISFTPSIVQVSVTPKKSLLFCLLSSLPEIYRYLSLLALYRYLVCSFVSEERRQKSLHLPDYTDIFKVQVSLSKVTAFCLPSSLPEIYRYLSLLALYRYLSLQKVTALLSSLLHCTGICHCKSPRDIQISFTPSIVQVSVTPKSHCSFDLYRYLSSLWE